MELLRRRVFLWKSVIWLLVCILKMISLRTFFLLTVFILVSINSFACPIIGQSPRTLPMRDFKLKAHFKYMSFTHYGMGEEWIQFGKDSSASSVLFLSEINYGFYDAFLIRAILPVSYQTQNFVESSSGIGVGDMVVDFKYNFYNPTKDLAYVSSPHWIYPEFSIMTGVRLPTGSKDTELPSGDGSTDLRLCGLVRVGNGIGAFYFSAGYWFNGITGDNIEDKFFYNLTFEFPPVIDKIIFLAELDGFATNEGRSHLVQICPGIKYRFQYTPGAKLYRDVRQELLLECALAVPLKAKGGFKYPVAPYVGVSWHF